MDLINNETICSALESLTSNALPTGSELKDQTSVEFDLTNLVSYITLISKTPGEKHNFILNMEDNDGNKFSKICTFVTPASSN